MYRCFIISHYYRKGHWRRAGESLETRSGTSQMSCLAFVGPLETRKPTHLGLLCKNKKGMTPSRHSQQTTPMAILRWPSMPRWPSDLAPTRRMEEARGACELKNKGRTRCRPLQQNLHVTAPWPRSSCRRPTKLAREPELWMKSPSIEVGTPAMASIEDLR
jgi:hypothetical protein